MTGEAHWFPVALVFGGAVLILIAGFLLSRVGRELKSEARLLDCPLAGGTFQGVIVRNTRSGEVTGVEACSAFQEPSKLACHGECVAELNRTEREAARCVEIGRL